MANEHISDMVVDALVLDMQDAFAAVSTTEKVGVARAGRLQDNPVKARIYVLVHINDPQDDSWRDSSVARRDQALDRFAFEAPAFEVGGGAMWWRRFSVEFGLFAMQTKEDRDEARRIANVTRGRIEKAIKQSARVPGLLDTLGEQAIMVMPVTSVVEEGGGPPASFIWRGSVQLQVLTERPF